MSDLAPIRAALKKAASPERAKINAWFFKTKPGEYGHGDQFMGVTVPAIRAVVRSHRDAFRADAEALIQSPIHEERLCGLLILVERYKRGDETEKKRVYTRYLSLAKKHINNWDLVDLSARDIVGEYLRTHENADTKVTLSTLARSKNLWERRIAIIATFAFIRAGDVHPTLTIAEMLLSDTHDLIHKAVGWMLRESWKREPEMVEEFLYTYGKTMPRTMLRYAIERMEVMQRKEFMARYWAEPTIRLIKILYPHQNHE